MKKVIAGMAILPERADRAEIAVESLLTQVDGMELAWQSMTEPMPDWLEYLIEHTSYRDGHKCEVHVRRCDNSRKGTEKFLCHEKYDDQTIWLGTDDDLEYPPGYVEMTKQWLAASAWQLVSWHGRVAAKFPMTSHYKDTHVFHCFGGVPSLVEVDFVGSGVSSFLLGSMRLTEKDFPILNAEDVTLSTAAWNRGMRSYVLPHPPGWLKYDHDAVPAEKTIWGMKRFDDADVTKHGNELIARKRRLK